MTTIAATGAGPVVARMRVRCVFCPQWLEESGLSLHLRDFHRIAFNVSPPATTEAATQTERRGGRRKDKKDGKRKSKSKRPAGEVVTSTPKKHQMDFKPPPFPVQMTTAEANTEDLECTYIEEFEIKLESEVEQGEEEYIEKENQQMPVDQADAVVQPSQKQVLLTTPSERPRKKATSRQRRLISKTKSKYKNISSGASMVYSFIGAPDSIMDISSLGSSDDSVPHCHQINYIKETGNQHSNEDEFQSPKTVSDSRKSQALFRETRSNSVEGFDPTASKAKARTMASKEQSSPTNIKHRELSSLKDDLHGLFSSPLDRRRVDAKLRRQLPERWRGSQKHKTKVLSGSIVKTKEKHKMSRELLGLKCRKVVEKAAVRELSRTAVKSLSRTFPGATLPPNAPAKRKKSKEVSSLKDSLSQLYSLSSRRLQLGSRNRFKVLDRALRKRKLTQKLDLFSEEEQKKARLIVKQRRSPSGNKNQSRTQTQVEDEVALSINKSINTRSQSTNSVKDTSLKGKGNKRQNEVGKVFQTMIHRRRSHSQKQQKLTRNDENYVAKLRTRSCSLNPSILETRRRRRKNQNLETDSDFQPQPQSESETEQDQDLKKSKSKPKAKDALDGYITIEERTTSSLIESKSRARLKMIEDAIERRMSKRFNEQHCFSRLESFQVKDYHKYSEEERQNMRSEIEEALSENARKRISSRKKDSNNYAQKLKTKSSNASSRKADLKEDPKSQPVKGVFPRLVANPMVVNNLDSLFKVAKEAQSDIKDIVNLSGKCKNRKMDAETYKYGETMRRKLRLKLRSQMVSELPDREGGIDESSSSSSTSCPPPASLILMKRTPMTYHPKFSCLWCLKKYNCR